MKKNVVLSMTSILFFLSLFLVNLVYSSRLPQSSIIDRYGWKSHHDREEIGSKDYWVQFFEPYYSGMRGKIGSEDWVKFFQMHYEPSAEVLSDNRLKFFGFFVQPCDPQEDPLFVAMKESTKFRPDDGYLDKDSFLMKRFLSNTIGVPENIIQKKFCIPEAGCCEYLQFLTNDIYGTTYGICKRQEKISVYEVKKFINNLINRGKLFLCDIEISRRGRANITLSLVDNRDGFTLCKYRQIGMRRSPIYLNK